MGASPDSTGPARITVPDARRDEGHHPKGSLAALALGALGVVYGDIGTSPLYTMRECFLALHGPIRESDVLGVLSTIFWALTLVVTVKYLVFILRADNRGEGGILALLALVPADVARASTRGGIGAIALLVMIGAGLLYGDGIITPAISVLGAIEGIAVGSSAFDHYVVPITCAILVLLFSVQSRGTGAIGALFGPVMIVWFLTLAGVGIWHIAQTPGVLAALSPHHAIVFFLRHGHEAFGMLGAVVLAVTGGEALYADLGHFGARPIRFAWLGVAMPSLVLAYFGQGALLLRDPAALENPFYRMVPAGWPTYALVVLATLAAIIASQALISGVFSLTNQAIQLGFFPRVTIRHTSSQAEGQIYVPEMNAALTIGCLVLVLVFRESSRLAGAYGLAVCGTMMITSVVYFVVTRYTWAWPVGQAATLLIAFLSFDVPFFVANAAKFLHGGYVPVTIAVVLTFVMVTWSRGRRLLAEHYRKSSVKVRDFLDELDQRVAARVPGCAVFMASDPKGTPPVLLHHARRSGSLHETVVLLSIVFEHIPWVAEYERVSIERMDEGFCRVIGRYGFMEAPNVPRLLEVAAKRHGLPIDTAYTTYYLGRETFLATNDGQMGRWSEMLFAFLARNARSATAYFCLPAEQVVEIGTQIDL